MISSVEPSYVLIHLTYLASPFFFFFLLLLRRLSLYVFLPERSVRRHHRSCVGILGMYIHTIQGCQMHCLYCSGYVGLGSQNDFARSL